MTAKVQIDRATAESAMAALIAKVSDKRLSRVEGNQARKLADEIDKLDAAINDLRTALAAGGEGKET